MEVNIDGRNITTEQDFHRHLAMALNVRQVYGCNLDALWDLLSASIERPITLRWKCHESSKANMGSDFDGIIEVLERVRLQDESFKLKDKFSYVLE